MHKIINNLQVVVAVSAAIFASAATARASLTLDFTATGTLGPVLSGSDPFALNGSAFAFTGFIDESATPTACPTGLPITPTVCYTIPANQLTGQVGVLPPVTIATPSLLAVVASKTSNDALEIQFSAIGLSVTAILQLAPGSFPPSILQHPIPFKPSPQALAAATSVPPPINGSSAQYCVGACSPSSETWLGITGNTSSNAPQLTTLFTFNGTNGNNPYSNLTADGTGGYYGTTSSGGASNMGAVFHLTPPSTGSTWTETVIYSFSGNDGATPAAAVFLLPTGVLFGTTRGGGVSNLGTVFMLTPPSTSGGAWTETVIHSFAGGNDGANPQAPVVVNSKGNLYGTTYAGGPANDGIVYQLAPPGTAGGAWRESLLHAFAGTDGQNPEAGLVFDKTGALNGTTYAGGASGMGTIFHLAPPKTGSKWTYTLLHSFAGGLSDGANPQSALVQDASNNFYGTTYAAGYSSMGTVFELTPPTTQGGTWTLLILHNFAGNDGANPQAGLVLSKNGAFYGTTAKGGLSNSGTIFQLAPSTYPGAWNETVLHNFNGMDGANPQASIVLDKNGLLYSTTVRGAGGHGTVFRSAP
jgi:uncharacterized repeat protein (TIGR03803 family)